MGKNRKTPGIHSFGEGVWKQALLPTAAGIYIGMTFMNWETSIQIMNTHTLLIQQFYLGGIYHTRYMHTHANQRGYKVAWHSVIYISPRFKTT